MSQFRFALWVFVATLFALLGPAKCDAQTAPLPAGLPAPTGDESLELPDAPGGPRRPTLPLPAPDDLPSSLPSDSRIPAQTAADRSTTPVPQGDFSARLARTPKMMGDFFGGSFSCYQFFADIDGDGMIDLNDRLKLSVPGAGPTDLGGRPRVYDNNAALPQDRVYFDYSYFHGAQLLPGGVGVNRFAPGVEKTFGDGLGSIEVRLPMSLTLNSTFSPLAPDTGRGEFGNALVNTKLVLAAQRDWVLAAGLGVLLPTGDDVVVQVNGADVLRIENESVHLVPFLAWGYSPQGSSRFAHAFMTYDFDTTGNSVSTLVGTDLVPFGVWNTTNIASLNVGYGGWVHEVMCPCDRRQGLAWSTELHYAGSINDPDIITDGVQTLGSADDDLSVLNATIGGHAVVGTTTFTLGYAAPLTSSERMFEGEVRFFVNRAY